MAKKIRFPLEMEHGVMVRGIEELRENFSLARVLIYFSNGKLITWLRDRYANDIADEIEKLNIEDKELPKKISKIFDVPYDEQSEMDLEKAQERNRKLSMLKEYTMEQRFLDVVDNVAFTQDDLYDLLDEGKNIIYLCGEKFSIPLAKKDMSYIGINNPIVVIDSKTEVDWQEKKITLKDIEYDEKYKKIIEDSTTKKQKFSEDFEDGVKKESIDFNSNTTIGGYSKNSYLNFMLSPVDKKAAESCYDKIRGEIQSLNYNIDDDICKIRNLLKDAGLIGMASNYIDDL